MPCVRAGDSSTSPQTLLKSSKLSEAWTLDHSASPLCLRGSFTGRDKTDYALQLKSKHGNRFSVAIITSDQKAYLTANEKEIGENYPGPGWKIHPERKRVPHRIDLNDGPAPVLKSDAILLFKPESSSALLYWKVGHLHLYWLTD